MRSKVLASLFVATGALTGYSGTLTDTCSRGLANMYPFGVATSDSIGATGDDGNSISLSWAGTPFKFFGVSYTTMYFSTNGWLCFSLSDTALSGPIFPTYANPVSG